MQETHFLNKGIFTETIEDNVFNKKMSYMEAIIETCDKYNIEPEDCKKFISNVIREKLEAEASSLNYLPKQNTLPFE